MKTTLYLASLSMAVLAGVAPDNDAAPILLLWAWTLAGLGVLCAVPVPVARTQAQ